MCHALVLFAVMGLKGPHYMDTQFIDYCPKERPAACWLKFTDKRGPGDQTVIFHGVCVNAKKQKVYEGRLAEMVDT